MSTAVDLKTKEEKDAELDRRIEALRKKNEALVRRYQEIEEDKKKAEQDGVAVMPARKPRPHEPEGDRRKTEKENFTVTVDLSKPAGEKRVINDWKQGTPRARRTPEEGDGSFRPEQGNSPPRRAGSGRLGRGGQRGGAPRQERREPREYNAADPRPDRLPMEGEAGEAPGCSERAPRGGRRGRGGRDGGGGQEGVGGEGRGGRGREGRGGGGPTQDGSGTDRKSKEWEEKRRQNIEKMNEEMEKIAEYERGQRADGDKPIRNFLDDPRRSGPAPDIDRKDGSRRHVRNWGGLDFDNVKTGAEQEKEWTSRRPGGPKGSSDMTMSMTGRERAEYLRWKKEREQIDEARLARHRNATGQWRREWDAQKTDTMFKEDPAVAAEGMPEQGSRRDDRPPKVPTFGDFLGQGRDKPRDGGRGERGRGRGRAQNKSYSMHDNRWEGEKENEEKEKEDKTKTEEKTKKKEERKPKAPSSNKAEEKNTDGGNGEEDEEDEWEDASDGEDEEMEGASDSEGEEEKEEEKNRKSEKEMPHPKADKKSPTSPPPSVPPPSASPKEQRTPLPKIHIPNEAQASPEGVKPLSPFTPLDGHQPVSDWGEEMEMQSPRSSLGESPLKPLSTENSPAQDKERKGQTQEESPTSSPRKPKAEPEKEEEKDIQTVAESVVTLVQDTPTTSDPVSSPTDSPTDANPEKERASTPPTVQETPATLAEDDAKAANPAPSETPSPAPSETPPPATVLEVDQSPSELGGIATETSEQTSSG